MRPASHREQIPEQRCGNCKFAHLVAYKLDLLCFHGDNIEVTGEVGYPVEAECIDLDGNSVDLMDGEEYSKVWAGRVVNDSDVCDLWGACSADKNLEVSDV